MDETLNKHGGGLKHQLTKKTSCAAGESGYVKIVNWQQFVSLGIVGMTALIFLRSRFKPRKFSWERDTHCGCSSPGQFSPQSSMVFRARRGERPQITVKPK